MSGEVTYEQPTVIQTEESEEVQHVEVPTAVLQALAATLAFFLFFLYMAKTGGAETAFCHVVDPAVTRIDSYALHTLREFEKFFAKARPEEVKSCQSKSGATHAVSTCSAMQPTRSRRPRLAAKFSVSHPNETTK
ncbi:unnamed protein product, partial [Mesorhabditis spiculigera]